MKKTALIIMIVTVISKSIGFLREITLSYFYGASNISDAYLISLTIPRVLFVVIGAGIATTFIPIYSNILDEKDHESGDLFSNNLINHVILISTIFIIFVLFFTDFIINLFASGFKGDTLILARKFTQISVFAIYFNGLIYIFKSYLQVNNNFIIPSMIGLPFNIIVISSIYISSKFNTYFLPIGIILAIASQLILVIIFAIKKGYKYEFVLNWKDKSFKKMFYLSLPVMLGTSVNQINLLVDRTLASRISIGGISALNYANRLNGFVQGVFVISIVSIIYPMLSKLAAGKKNKLFKEKLNLSIIIISLFVIPISIGSMIFSKQIITLLFARGAFELEAINMTSYSLFFYSIGMIGFGLRHLLSRSFYALQDTKTPMINAAIGMILNIILNLILSKYIGLGGLALATSISALVTALLMFITLRQKIGPFGLKNIMISVLKILFSSIIMAYISKNIYLLSLNYLFSQNISLIFSIFIGVLIYSIIIYFLNIEEVNDVIYMVKEKYFVKFLEG